MVAGAALHCRTARVCVWVAVQCVLHVESLVFVVTV